MAANVSPPDDVRCKTLVIGTGNPDKLKELQALLSGLKVRVIPISRFRNVPDVVENGRTFKQNAAKKARVYSRFVGARRAVPLPLVLADDSGLCVRALGRRPGVYSARFAGPGCTYEDNNRKLLRLLAGKGPAKRKASFHCVAALYKNGRKVKIFEGVCKGKIAEKARGANGFGYDPVFVPDGTRKTFAQLSRSQKNRLSHRAKALKQVRGFLRKYFRGKG